MECEIERLDDFGRGICYIDGKICFVYDALPGERVSIDIKTEKKRYLEGVVSKYIKKSPFRISSGCSYYDVCGGCNLRGMDIRLENEYKEDKVKNLLSKFSNINTSIVRPIISNNDSYYRNKIVLHGKDGKLGFYKDKTNEIVEIDKCMVSNSKINEIIPVLKLVNKAIDKVLVRTSNDLSSILVDIVGEVKDIHLLVDYCDVLIVNGEYLTEKKKIISTIGDYKFYLSVNSFFQVNSFITESLYNETKKVVEDVRPHNVLDLYCGTGTIGIYVSKYCDNVIGIDYNKSNIQDALENKKLNGVKNIEFILDKVENRIDSFNNIDLIIVDPPRAGLDSKTREYILEILPEVVIYTSCDPVTLVRDLDELSSKYEICYVQPFNNFSRTYHVECVSVLCRKTLIK